MNTTLPIASARPLSAVMVRGRGMTLERSSAGSFEIKSYAPLGAEAVWREGRKHANLPAAVFSSELCADNLIQFRDERRSAGKERIA